ncbi:MAG: Metallo-beta-lactamase class [Myxococcaceae bacterium]|nr:Metallo-beta-lactamase class [Myxococcaceae bacterium]
MSVIKTRLGVLAAAVCALSWQTSVRAETKAAPSDAAAAGLRFAPETAASLKHVEAAKKLAGQDLQPPLFLCQPDSLLTVKKALEIGSQQWVEPTKAFDNLFYVGNEFVGVWVLQTSGGLILFDATSSAQDAEQKLVPGLVKLGLRPADIKYVVVTHGHWDHYGGAAYLQKTFGAHIALGAADWDLIEKLSPSSPEIADHPAPSRDIALVDGQKLVLGDTSVTIRITPGHTPATVSAIVPAREGNKTYPLSLFGSFAFPSSYEPTEKVGGLRKYDASVRRFSEESKRARTVGILNTHVFADGTLARLAAARARKVGEPNSFLIGAPVVARYYGVLHECLQAALARPETVPDLSKLTKTAQK